MKIVAYTLRGRSNNDALGTVSAGGTGFPSGAPSARIRARMRMTRSLVRIVVAGAALALGAVFVMRMAAPNVVSAGMRASERAAVSTLRTLVWAQDRMIQRHGRAGLLGELTGARGVGGEAPGLPLVQGALRRLESGPHGEVGTAGGYHYVVYVLGEDGRPLGGPPGAPRAGARRWIAYAWPSGHGVSGRAAFCVNQHEDILQTANDAPGQGYDGTRRMPAWDACVTSPTPPGEMPAFLEPGVGADGGRWVRWRGTLTRRAREARGS